MRQSHPLQEKGKQVRSASMRKLAKDGKSWTPTESRKRDRMLKQFCKKGRKGVAYSGNSEAYKAGWDAIDWSKG